MAKGKKAPASLPKKASLLAKESPGSGNPRLYTLEVFVTRGPVPRKFTKKHTVISRTIQIRGDQTLDVLHEAIFDAYDRFDEHMYEFQFGNRPMEGPRYVLPMALNFGNVEEAAGLVTETTIDSLKLKEGRAFGYWFDFGDDWYHQIEVLATEPDLPPGKYPKVTKRVGKSPPQYMEEDEE